jgi:nicotinate-nucleotide adenylyltransferase
MTPDDREPIGLLGGSFDPIHIGHLQLASDALQQLGLARVLLIPAGLAWQKGAAADGAHRARMVELSIASEPRFALDRRELQRPGPSFTVDTLRQLRQEAGAVRPLVLLIGADQFQQLDTWHNWEQLIELAHLAVAARPGYAATPNPPLTSFRNRHLGSSADLAQKPAGVLVQVAMKPVDCSSTQIRALLGAGPAHAGKSVAPLLAPGVLDYIRQHRLYA